MCATTKFHRRTITYYTYFVTIFFTEQRHCPHCTGFGNRHITVFVERDCSADFLIGKMFHLAQLLWSDFLEMGEVETQKVGRHI